MGQICRKITECIPFSCPTSFSQSEEEKDKNDKNAKKFVYHHPTAKKGVWNFSGFDEVDFDWSL